MVGNQPTLEIRAFDVPFRITDGQKICNFELFNNNGTVLKPYGIKGRESNYKIQKGAKLPKYFKI
jgi:deoxycytidine triphosphate deaminase